MPVVGSCNHNGVDLFGLEHLPEVCCGFRTSLSHRSNLLHSAFVWVTDPTEDSTLFDKVFHQVLPASAASNQTQKETFIGASDSCVRGGVVWCPDKSRCCTRFLQKLTACHAINASH